MFLPFLNQLIVCEKKWLEKCRLSNELKMVKKMNKMSAILLSLTKMLFRINLILIITLACIMSVNIFPGCQIQSEEYRPGLTGLYYSEPDLTSIKGVIILDSLEQYWDINTDFRTGSSGLWNGFIIAPVDGQITFFMQTNKIAILEIGEYHQTESNPEKPLTELVLNMKKDQAYPVRLTFYNDGEDSDYGAFSIKWQWDGQEKSSIPISHFKHSVSQSEDLNWLSDPDPESIDFSQFLRVPARHVVVYYEPGRFAGWPANNGVWVWGDEILVGFSRAFYRENKYHHSIDRLKQGESVLARSADGGETWQLEDPDNFIGDGLKPVTLTERMNFSHSGFALRCGKTEFFISYSRGKSWQGPYVYPDFKVGELTARTDYLVNGKDNCLLFLSAKNQNVKASLQDRSFCAQTTDGGKSIHFLSWIAETDTVRSVMSSTVRVSKNHLISALRRRLDPEKNERYVLPKNWIDVYQSLDNGINWEFLSKIADTDLGKRNGNPPSLVRRKDGLLCVTYAYRGIPYSIRAKISVDNGKTWSKEIILRDDARTFDIGYTRSVARTDGNIVTIYYYTSKEKKEQHIAATIWNPDYVSMN